MPEPIYTLGINAAFHDSAACLVRDGVVVAAAEEERFTHVKHAKRPVPFSTWELPYHAIDYCLAEAGIALADVQHVAYSYDPWLELDRRAGQPSLTLPLEPSAHARPPGGESPWHPLFLSSIVNAPRQLAGGAPHHLQRRFRGVTHDGPFRWHFVEHHLAHEASAFLAAPYERCAVMTMDGRGERATTSYGVFDGRAYRRIAQVDLPHSLGLLYERVTRYLGFLHSSDEYKVMALASYGKPIYADQMRQLVRYRGDGRYDVDEADLVALFGPARDRGGPITPNHCDIAHALQLVLEETTLRAVEWLAAETGEKQLAMAGGVALNCVMNARIRDRGPFDDVWVQPAAGDAGTALGAALWTDFRERGARGDWRMDHAYLGPSFEDDAIEAFIREAQLPYRRLNDVAAQTAALLAQNRVIGWFQGRMEFGPRALGARSILASPIDPDMQRKLNRIKDREDFRPVAPVALESKAHEWFSGGRREPLHAPFMLFVYDVRPERAERIPAVRHIDGTARVQTVAPQQNPLLHALLTEFDALTGVPVLVNTSFNTRGEPIVCTPRDAIECFWTSPLDALVIGSFLMEKPR
ncbi:MULTISPECIES: carbamoyltransferase family protein [Burkholderia]|uniref:carbamoyltransferase family protein n=1 Tax=Burkholderia TaxID=32008 RepID=UPI0008A5A9A3|nr:MULTISPECIES: carbamoyltransferase C-terminal domain-containing protein [Burkholderia]MBJ9681079.1 carbamoyltransferase [Burkholderia multivorans]MDR8918727.1 Decarbamoylnovobiocin carbamoyltransferase [Burkholderia multivorans]MDR8924113.1 Decarbamoylnovobiocin carbamoyltransferase [Burkholderia multivorans]MDR8969384.1 Decarbamoylnovobiocin carbamoyltransferase [Burkholderia multivorans]MDR8992181.1 Decarbamoylnovobiocin carbamoyltransferase [Burkholderia multivorans]